MDTAAAVRMKTSEMETKVKEEVESLENKAVGEAKHLEGDIGLLEGDPGKTGGCNGQRRRKDSATTGRLGSGTRLDG